MNVKHIFVAALFALVTSGAFAQTAKPAAAAQTGKLPVAEHYAGGQDSLVAHLQRSIQYPAMAKRNRVMGTCIIHFTLSEDGVISNAKILKEVGGGTGQEALRVVKLLKFKAPGYSQEYSVPVSFKL
ncbi:energy transducer TonB [Rufibacter sediminis]|uniref:Energy transducer TonB n=1 Tax=Rufibacter sediminis TaxID=2762756 RepID=A0ABR6VVS3_9BACT|nr:energy transducer TonB [Rufibacter sediminis]MBC3541279.1 energy transducer TonB [Rufibacter sediminis]